MQFTLKDFLFGALELTKNVDPDKISYFGYGIGFNSRSHFLTSNSDFRKNVVIFYVDNSSSKHTDNKKKFFLALCKEPTQELSATTITVEAKYSINFTRSKKKI